MKGSPRRSRASLAVAAVLVAGFSCGGTTSLTAIGNDREDRGGVSRSCTSPRIDADASADGCRLGAFLLQCRDPSGSGATCVTNDPDRCADGPVNCHNECGVDEYAAACGRVGPGGYVAPPSQECRSRFPTPGGVVFYCCPCGP
jgi:hypothetical protein